MSTSTIDAAPFPGEQTTWHGYPRYDFLMDEDTLAIVPFTRDTAEGDGVGAPPEGKRRGIVVCPETPAPGRPWSWRGCYWNHEPQTEIELLRRGFHIVFVSPRPDRAWDAWYAFLTQRHALSAKPAFVGMSMGGVHEFDWATAHPDKVACIYADNPAIRPTAFAKLDELARHQVPILDISGSLDFLLPVNTLAIEEVYLRAGGRFTLVVKEGVAHHPHSLKNPQLAADWIERYVHEDRDRRPDFADDTFAKGYYYSFENVYNYLEEERTYFTGRGPGFTPVYEQYDARTKSDWGTLGMSVIAPEIAAPGKPWMFRTDPIARDARVEQVLLARGFHIVIAPLTRLHGPNQEDWDATYDLLIAHGFSPKPVLAGVGAAAGEAYAWAIAHPDRVSCIYGESPILRRSLMSQSSPLDNLAPLAKAGIPILHHSGSLDPWLESQTHVAAARYRELGGDMIVILREGVGHYPTAPSDPAAIVEFIVGKTLSE